MPRLMGALSATGVILGAVYLLFMFQKVFFGKLDKTRNGKLPDLRPHELIVFIILCLAIIAGGLFPAKPLSVMEPSVQKFLRDFSSHVGEPDAPPHIYGKLPSPPSANAAAPQGGVAPTGAPTPPGGAVAVPTPAGGAAAGGAAGAVPSPAGGNAGAVPTPAPGAPTPGARAPGAPTAGAVPVPVPGHPVALPDGGRGPVPPPGHVVPHVVPAPAPAPGGRP
jgi:hypothetical protein